MIPPPEGVDVSKAESIAENINRFSVRHYITPFLAHAVGTFAGALAAHYISSTTKNISSHIVGGLFLTVGIYACTQIPAPAWFMALDVLVAYIPMGFAAAVVGTALAKRASTHVKVH